MDRCTHGIVHWTRTQRLHLFSVYGPPCTSPQADQARRILLDCLQETLAALGGVPWLMGGGGDWNITPPDSTALWRRHCRVSHTSGPTQKHGRNLDWFVHSPAVVSTRPTAVLMPFTDHVAVTLRLRGDLHRTLGHKLVSPKGLTQEALQPLRSDDTKDALHRRFGAPPPRVDPPGGGFTLAGHGH